MEAVMGSVPEFEGFPKEGLAFFGDLSANNNREWFEAHKRIYQDAVVAPAQAFVADLGERLKTLSPDFGYDLATNGSGSIMRIYRDIRFSKDKTPYKTNIGIRFWDGSNKKGETPGYHFFMDASGATLYAGFYAFPKPFLEAFRSAVADAKQGVELREAIAAVKGAGDYVIGGEQLKRVPAGFDANHPSADLLRYTALYAQSPKMTGSDLSSPQLAEIAFKHCQNMYSFHRCLMDIQKAIS
jgi:uncharacterized protein (TIGR02453 family)